MVIRVLNDLDKGLFADFIAPKTEVLTSILRAGIADPSVNWMEMVRPTGEFYNGGNL
jgi:exocyst complex component 2